MADTVLFWKRVGYQCHGLGFDKDPQREANGGILVFGYPASAYRIGWTMAEQDRGCANDQVRF